MAFSGAVGGDSSVKSFVASAPYVTWLWSAVNVQNVLAPGCSKAAAYVCGSYCSFHIWASITYISYLLDTVQFVYIYSY